MGDSCEGLRRGRIAEAVDERGGKEGRGRRWGRWDEDELRTPSVQSPSDMITSSLISVQEKDKSLSFCRPSPVLNTLIDCFGGAPAASWPIGADLRAKRKCVRLKILATDALIFLAWRTDYHKRHWLRFLHYNPPSLPTPKMRSTRNKKASRGASLPVSWQRAFLIIQKGFTLNFYLPSLILESGLSFPLWRSDAFSSNGFTLSCFGCIT